MIRLTDGYARRNRDRKTCSYHGYLYYTEKLEIKLILSAEKPVLWICIFRICKTRSQENAQYQVSRSPPPPVFLRISVLEPMRE